MKFASVDFGTFEGDVFLFFPEKKGQFALPPLWGRGKKKKSTKKSHHHFNNGLKYYPAKFTSLVSL